MKDERLNRVADQAVAAVLADVLVRLDNVESALADVIVEQAAEQEGLRDGPDALALALNSKLASVLIAADYGTLGAIRAASDEALLAVDGINAKALKLIRERIG